MTVTVFGYLILIIIDFCHPISSFFLVSPSFDWEDILNTKDCVWPHFQTPRSLSKILRYASNFQLFSRCLEMWSNTVFRVWYITSRIASIFSDNHSSSLSSTAFWVFFFCLARKAGVKMWNYGVLTYSLSFSEYTLNYEDTLTTVSTRHRSLLWLVFPFVSRIWNISQVPHFNSVL